MTSNQTTFARLSNGQQSQSVNTLNNSASQITNYNSELTGTMTPSHSRDIVYSVSNPSDTFYFILNDVSDSNRTIDLLINALISFP